jgi:hypothetical protein
VFPGKKGGILTMKRNISRIQPRQKKYIRPEEIRLHLGNFSRSLPSPLLQKKNLKGQYHEIFDLFHGSVSPKPLIIALEPFQTF